MIDLNGVRSGALAGCAGASVRTGGKRTPSLAENIKGLVAPAPETARAEAADAGTTPSGMRVLRLKYTPSMVTMDATGCDVRFDYAEAGEAWDPTEMTDDEWEWLRNEVADMAGQMGLDPASVPVYLIPPGVGQRMGEENFNVFISGRLTGGDPGHWLVVNAKGELTDLGFEGSGISRKDSHDVLWQKVLERQAEYQRYIQQARTDHAQELSRLEHRLEQTELLKSEWT